ncbi:MAG: hypothetical protein JWM86_2064 [Thermoleophilia bacterium]|nr:hypothetical protein [Thermoleophilia bacterium]
MRDEDERDGAEDDDVEALAADGPSERDPRLDDPREDDHEPKADEPQIGDEVDGLDDGDADSDEDADGNGGSSRAWKAAAIVAVIAAAVALGVLGSLLFFDGGASEQGDDVRACQPVRDFTKDGADDRATGEKCPPAGATMTDGLVQKTTDGGFTMRTIESGRLSDTIELHVRKPDRAYIDIAHAQTHAALGQPIRVYTERIDGRESVVYMEDAPLLK